MKKVTLDDIATELGITKMTVSRALNNNPGVSRSLKREINQKAQDMGYVPANRQTGNKNNAFGIIISEVYLEKNDVYYSDLLKNLIERLEDIDKISMVYILKKDKINQLPKMCEEMKVDGVFIIGELPQSYIELIGAQMDNVVLIDYKLEGYNSVYANNYNAAFKLTKLLHENGHSKIGFIGTRQYSQSVEKRSSGFISYLMKNNLDLTNAFIDDRNSEGKLIDLQVELEKYTAIICNNDFIANKIIRKIKSEGLTVPGDISVVSFDDTIYSILSAPQITTMTIDREKMIHTAIKLMHQEEEKNESIEMILIERSSVQELN